MLIKFLIVAALITVAYGSSYYKINAESEATVRRVCKENSAEDKADSVVAGFNRAVNCSHYTVDLTAIINSMLVDNDVDKRKAVINTQCSKASQLEGCWDILVESVSPCITDTIREYINISWNATRAFIDYACYNDGERIISFYANKGMQCMIETREEVRACGVAYQKSIEEADKTGEWSVETFCRRFVDFSKCSVNALRKCSDPAPAAQLDSLFSFIRTNTGCRTN